MTGTARNPIPAAAGRERLYHQLGLVGAAMADLDQTTSVGFEAIIELDGPIDRQRLERAWDSVRARHPLLGCRLEDGVWIEDPEAPGPVAMTVSARDSLHELKLTCDHVAFDGVGSVILLSDLRDAYMGKSWLDEDWSPRVFEEFASPASLTGDLATAIRAASRWRNPPGSTHTSPATETPRKPSTGWFVMDLGETLRALAYRRREQGWSTDALLVAVLERAWSTVFGPADGDSVWLIAQDLRPDLELARGLGNLSIIDAVTVGGVLEESADTVTNQMARNRPDLLRSVLMGSRYPALAEALIGNGFARGQRLRYFRSLSNVGQLGETLDDWDGATASRVYFVGPMAHPPYTSFIAAGRGDSTLVTVRTSPDWLTDAHARDLELAALALAR